MSDLNFGDPLPPIRKSNPMLIHFGAGPKDKKCGDCRFLSAHGYSRIFYKCELRGVSSSVATDHRLKWPTCGKFEAVKLEAVKP